MTGAVPITVGTNIASVNFLFVTACTLHHPLVYSHLHIIMSQDSSVCSKFRDRIGRHLILQYQIGIIILKFLSFRDRYSVLNRERGFDIDTVLRRRFPNRYIWYRVDSIQFSISNRELVSGCVAIFYFGRSWEVKGHS